MDATQLNAQEIFSHLPRNRVGESDRRYMNEVLDDGFSNTKDAGNMVTRLGMSETLGNMVRCLEAGADVPLEALAEDETLAPSGDSTTTYAGWILRRLVEAGWLEREQQVDYTELIVLPDYAFTLLEALRANREAYAANLEHHSCDT
jgi:hypothetical protein